jgi:SPX domain protein involved in polyphosphate accumulation
MRLAKPIIKNRPNPFLGQLLLAAQKQEFIRIEDKYVISSEYEQDLLERLASHMIPSYLNDDTKYTLIESIYFDSSDFCLFQQHFKKIPERYKLRIRRYAPNGIWENQDLLVELKCKKRGISQKTRFKISTEQLDALCAGKLLMISHECHERNLDLPAGLLKKRIVEVNNLIKRYELRPVMKVGYKRYAFEMGGVRATLDRDLQAHHLYNPSENIKNKIREQSVWERAKKNLKKYNHEKRMVLEIKHSGKIPKWMETYPIMAAKTSFSKYCWGVAGFLSESSLQA